MRTTQWDQPGGLPSGTTQWDHPMGLQWGYPWGPPNGAAHGDYLMGPPRGQPPMGRPVGTTAQRGSNARISWPPGQGKIWGQEARRGPKTKLAETSLANGPGQDARPPGHRHTGCRAPGPKATEKGHVYGPAHSRLQRTVQRALATPGRNRGAEPMGPRHHGAGPPHQRATEKKGHV